MRTLKFLREFILITGHFFTLSILSHDVAAMDTGEKKKGPQTQNHGMSTLSKKLTKSILHCSTSPCFTREECVAIKSSGLSLFAADITTTESPPPIVSGIYPKITDNKPYYKPPYKTTEVRPLPKIIRDPQIGGGKLDCSPRHLKLDRSHCDLKLDKEETLSLLEIIKDQKITELSLWDNIIKDDNAIFLVKELRNIPQLTILDLGRNEITTKRRDEILSVAPENLTIYGLTRVDTR